MKKDYTIKFVSAGKTLLIGMEFEASECDYSAFVIKNGTLEEFLSGFARGLKFYADEVYMLNMNMDKAIASYSMCRDVTDQFGNLADLIDTAFSGIPAFKTYLNDMKSTFSVDGKIMAVA